MRIHISSFVRRQTADSSFSHWTIDDAEFMKRIHANFSKAKPGYRPDVLLVPIEPDGFYSNTVKLKSGDRLIGEFTPRREGEFPRKHTYALTETKQPAVAVDVVLYSHAALLEGHENESDADYEVVAVLARDTVEAEPIAPMVLMANHFEADGGTKTNMTPEQFEELLRKSFNYWKDKASVAPKGFIYGK
jgi:Protein of unknown function (DUF3228)